VEFVVGTGGNCCYPFGSPEANSLFRETGTIGVLELTLHPDSYEFRFVVAPDGASIDSGGASCH
jgi:hypothetical protein